MQLYGFHPRYELISFSLKLPKYNSGSIPKGCVETSNALTLGHNFEKDTFIRLLTIDPIYSSNK